MQEVMVMCRFICVGVAILITIYGVYSLINAGADIFLIISELAISISGIITIMLAYEEGKDEE